MSRTVTFLLATLVTVASAEGSLQVLSREVPAFKRVLFPSELVPILPDARLGRRGNPDYIDHDDLGFRNPDGTPRDQVVAIGDSQTYGMDVRASEAWPRALARLSGCSVYSMALGGYGPLQYAELAHDAVAWKPRLLLVAIYFGNDFFDNWETFLNNPSRYPVPDELLRPAMDAEHEAPLTKKVDDFFLTGSEPPEPDRHSRLRQALSRHSALWAFSRAVRDRLVPHADALSPRLEDAAAGLTLQQKPHAWVFSSGPWRTIFTPAYRLSVEDAADPRVILGRWLTEWALGDIADTARVAGIPVVFVMLPTKEAAFAGHVSDPGQNPHFARLVADEAQHRAHLAAFFEARGLKFLDARPVLESQSKQPYFENADGHPNPIGHAAIAAALKEYLPACRK